MSTQASTEICRPHFGRDVTPERIQSRLQYFLYRWRRRYRRIGLSALHDRTKAPRKRRRRIVSKVPVVHNETWFCQ